MSLDGEEPRGSMVEAVQQEVERMIITGELEAGARISEQSIAERLGISRGPVREAFRALTEAGLLIGQRNRGVVVREIGREELRDLYQVRAAIEGELAAAALERLTSDVLFEFDLVQRDMRDALKQQDTARYFAANVQFDAILVATCPNETLRDLHRSITRKMMLVRRRRLSGVDDMKRSFIAHSHLLEILRKGDPDEVRTAFRNFILEARDRL
ncbi:MAG: FCD domain-containing protein [Loktanella sp.]|nr:FCD domain-containing protein [Loktanella sp.]